MEKKRYDFNIGLNGFLYTQIYDERYYLIGHSSYNACIQSLNERLKN